MAAAFIPGAELARAFYLEAVRPVLAASFPSLAYDAGLLGPGSDVLGFDTERSTDHDWGPRLQLFLEDADLDLAPAVIAALSRQLPVTFRGWPTGWATHESGSAMPEEQEPGDVRHRIEVTSLRRFCLAHIGFEPEEGVSVVDWLATPSQELASIAGGHAFHSGVGAVARAREALAWYPPDVWRYLVANQWRRISQEQPFVGRTGEVGDDVGSRVIAARLVRDAMRLALLLSGHYPPYSKWLGTAFARLELDAAPLLTAVLAQESWPERQECLAHALAALAQLQNETGISAPLDPSVRWFHDRPFAIVDAEGFAETTRAGIADREVLALPPWLGSIDQVTDSTDVVNVALRQRVRALYRTG